MKTCTIKHLLKDGLPISSYKNLCLRLRLARGYYKLILKRQHGAAPKTLKKTDPLAWLYENNKNIFGDWALSWQTGCFISNLLEIIKPKTIVELGSGSSTLIFAKYVQTHKEISARVFSFDHDEFWMDKTKDLLKKNQLDTFANLIPAPLTEYSHTSSELFSDPPKFDGNNKWYSIETDKLNETLQNRKIDLLLVDGPPNESSRAPALPVFWNHMSNNGIVMLDDVRRLPEYNALQWWIEKAAQNVSLAKLLPDGQGQGIVFLEKQERANQNG